MTMFSKPAVGRVSCGTPFLQAGEITCSINNGVETFNVDINAIPTKVMANDIDEPLKLFRDLLGLKFVLQRRLDSEETPELVAAKFDYLRATVLGLGEEVFGTAALIEFENRDGEVIAPLHKNTNRLISGPFAPFRTRKIDEVFKKVERTGYEIIYPPKVPNRTSDPVAKQREFMFRDSEGVLVKLVEIDPA